MSEERDIDALGATVALEQPCAVGSASTIAMDVALAEAVASGRVSGTFPGSGGDIELRPFGPYTKVEALGDQGSMGIVARGYNEAFDRWELLKFLRADHALDPSRVRQFHREGRVLARLSHPNVVQVFAIYQMEGRPCLAMEFLRGDSLAKLVSQEPSGLAIERWYALFLDAARGLSAAHQVGLLHRDLKPDNLFVVEDRKGGNAGLKLIDFGLATADQTRPQEPRDSMVADLSGGTPVYMAPELWNGQLATQRTDIFALGLTFTFAAAGRLPFRASTIVEALNAITSPEPFPDPRDARPDLPRRLSDVLLRATSKSPEQRFESVDDLVAALVAAWDSSRPRRVPGSGPYRGLRPYTQDERDVFFGRDEEIANVLEKLRQRAGVVVVGPSGAGKSSLVRAGVVPAILDGGLGNDVDYEALVIVPGRRPLEAIAAAVAASTSASEEGVLAFLRQSPERLGAALREAASGEKGYVLVVDPLEAFADDEVDPAEARAACIAIASLLDPIRPELRIVASVRADRMDRLFEVEVFRSWLTHGFHPIRLLRGDSLRDALVEPARTACYELESPALADEIVESADRMDTALPLVSFAMQAWWERRDEAKRLLPTAAWVELGGVEGALVRHAETVVAALDRDLRATAESMLIRLVRADGSRCRLAVAQLLDPATALSRGEDALDVLVQARILQESFDQVEIVHDALVRRWPRLRQLLESAGEDRAFRERIGSAASIWEAQGRADGALWTGDQASQLERWLASTKATLTQAELAFAEAVQRRSARKRLVLRSVLACALLVVVGFVVVAKTNERDMAAKLEAAMAERNQAHQAFRKAEASRLRLLAETYATSRPREALRVAAKSYELETHPLVDTIAWRAHAQGIPHPIPPPEGGASIVRFSPGGKWLALGGDDGVVVLLNSTNEHHHVVRLGGSPGAVSSVVFPGGEDEVAIGTVDGWVGSGPVDAGTFTAERACDGVVRGIRSAGTGRRIVVCRTDTRLQVVLTGGKKQDLAAGEYVPIDLHSMPFPLLTRAGDLAWLDTNVGAVTKLKVKDDIVAADYRGNAIAIGTASGNVYLELEGTLREVAAHGAPIRRVRVAPHADVLLSTDDTGVVRLSTFKGEVLAGAPSARAAFAWLPKRDAVAVSNDDRSVEIWSTLTGEKLSRLSGVGDTVLGLDADPLGHWVVASSDDGTVVSFAVEEATWRVMRGPQPEPGRCVVSPDGVFVACASGAELQVTRFDVRLKPETRVIERVDKGEVVSLVAGAKDGLIRWSTTEGRYAEGRAEAGPPAEWIGFDGRGGVFTSVSERGARKVRGDSKEYSLPAGARVLALSPRGHVLAGNDRNELLVIDESDEPEVHVFESAASQDRITALVVTDDGESFVAATQLGRLGLGRFGERPIVEFGRIAGGARCLAVARSGRVVVAASAAGVVEVFDSQSHATLFEHPLRSPVQACARSPVEDRFTFVSRDGSVRMRWLDLAPLATSRAEATDRVERWAGLPTERAW